MHFQRVEFTVLCNNNCVNLNSLARSHTYRIVIVSQFIYDKKNYKSSENSSPLRIQCNLVQVSANTAPSKSGFVFLFPPSFSMAREGSVIFIKYILYCWFRFSRWINKHWIKSNVYIAERLIQRYCRFIPVRLLLTCKRIRFYCVTDVSWWYFLNLSW